MEKNNEKLEIENAESKKVSKSKCIKEIIFLIVWLGIIIKLFIFDWDVFLIEKYLPNFRWILNFKILIIVILIVLTSKKKCGNILLNIIYFVFFPLVLVFVYLPFKIFLIGKWNGLIAYLNTFFILFKKFRFKFVISILYCVCFSIILNNSNKYLIIFSIIFIIYCVFSLVILMFKIVFSNSTIFDVYKKISDKILEQVNNNKNDECPEITDINSLKENKQYVSVIERTVLMNRIFLFSSRKFKDYNESKVYIFQDILLFISILIIGVLSFSLINFGLFKLYDNNYILQGIPKFIDFVLYTMSISNGYIVSSSILAKLLLILQTGLFIIFSGLFIFIVLNKNKEKQKKEIGNIINSFEEMAKMEEDNIINTTIFDNMDSAIEGLKLLESSLVGIITKISKSI
jgi:hypothetical protein